MSYIEEVQSSKSIAVGETYTYTIEPAVYPGTTIALTIGVGSGTGIYNFKGGVASAQEVITGVVVTYNPFANTITVVNGYQIAVTFRSLRYTVDNDAYMFGPYKKKVPVRQFVVELGTMTASGGVYSATSYDLYTSVLSQMGIDEDYMLADILVGYSSVQGVAPDENSYRARSDVYNNRLYPYVEIADGQSWWSIHYTTTDSTKANKSVWVKLIFVKM